MDAGRAPRTAGVTDLLSREAAFSVSAALLCTAVLSVLAAPGYWEDPTLVAPAVAIDLSLGLPVLGYLFLVRGRETRRWMLAPLFVLGLALSRWWIPAAHQNMSGDFFPFLVGVSEAALTLFVIVRAVRIAAEYGRLQGLGRSRADSARHALAQALGDRLGGVLFTELSVLWYAGRLLRRPTEPGAGGDARFTVHRRNAYPAVLGVLLLLILVESASAHLLLGLWSPKAAWASTAIGVYSAVWLSGDYSAARVNPISMSEDVLVLSVGLRWHVTLRWPEIVAIHDRAPTGESLQMTMIGPADFWLELDRPTKVNGPFGITRTVRYVGVGLDAPAELRAAIVERTARPGPTAA